VLYFTLPQHKIFISYSSTTLHVKSRSLFTFQLLGHQVKGYHLPSQLTDDTLHEGKLSAHVQNADE